MPEIVRRVHIREQAKIGEYLVIDSVAALIAVLNGDILELHAWNSKAEHLEQPDRLVFDLDPAPGVAFTSVVDAALLLRARLQALGLESWPKSTGGKGLHVVVPLRPELGWDACFLFSHAVAASLARDAPQAFTITFSKARRTDRILIDYKRNHRAAVAVAAYSPRARPNGAVSVPLAWRELQRLPAADHYTVLNLRERLARLDADPWRGYWTCRQRLRLQAMTAFLERG